MIKIEKINEVYIRVTSDDHGVLQEISQFFSFDVPGAKFTPQYRARLWDGVIRLYDMHRKTLYVGLLKYVLDFAERNGYEVKELNEVISSTPIEKETVKKFAEFLNPCSRGEPITIRDYQIEAVTKAITDERTLLLSPTASGKSFIIYTLMRYHLEHSRKCIIIVPTTSLVEQMYSDFADYSTGNGWKTQNNCQKLYSGFTKEFPKTRYTLTLENGKTYTVSGNETIRMINKSIKKISELSEGDDIDEKWIEQNIHRLQTS